PIVVSGAAGDVRGPVSGVHVPHGDQIAGAYERQQPPPEAGIPGDGDAAENLRKAWRGPPLPPSVRRQALHVILHCVHDDAHALRVPAPGPCDSTITWPASSRPILCTAPP